MLLRFYKLNSIICLDNNKVSDIFTRMRNITLIIMMLATIGTTTANSLPPTFDDTTFLNFCEKNH